MVNRITGFSGFDVDGTIQKLMKVEQAKVDTLKQSLQLLSWQKDAYREITNAFRSFKDEYFNNLKPATNFRSATAFASFTTTSSDTSKVVISAGAGAVTGSHNVNVISLATNAIKTGGAGVSKGTSGGLTGTNSVDDMMSQMKKGKQFTLTLDGVTKTIVLDQNYTDIDELAGGLQNLVNDAFGSGKITVSRNNDKLNFKPATSSSSLKIADGTNTYLNSLGFANGQSNAITSGEITDFSGGTFKLQIGDGTVHELNVAGASDRDGLITKINSVLADEGFENIKAIADSNPENPTGIKLVSLNSADKVTVTSGSTDDLLAKLGIKSGSSINLNGTINYSTNDIGKDFYIKVDGVQYHIDLTEDFADDAAFQTEIRDQLTTQGAPADLEVNIVDGKISFKTTNTHEIVILKGDDGLRDELGFTDAVNSNKISLTDSMEKIAANLTSSEPPDEIKPYDAEGKIEFTVNGVTITATKEDSLKSIMDKVNNSSAGVTMRYDSLSDKFVLESKSAGLAEKVDVEDVKGEFFKALQFNMSEEVSHGTDAKLTIDGTEVTRSTNKFAIDGVTYELKGIGESTVTVAGDPDKLLSNIKEFVNKYNSLIDTISNKLNEKSYKYATKNSNAYAPLTDEQKKEMSEDEIKLWEEKAKSGLLRSDSLLEQALDDFRSTLYAKVEGVDISLYDIGITTSNAWTDNGKLVIDEEKLKQAIQDMPDKVTQLFTQESEIPYDSSDRSTRFKQQGIAQRMFDVIEDNIRTTRDSMGNKGALLVKAGMENDTTDQENVISEQMKEQNKRLEALLEKLQDKEDYYYQMFSAMEVAIQNLNSQSAWLAQQFGSSQ
ncbi:flagellar filament capping protein FliD [Desulforamulus ruminis]|uniref:flagellar filament capping protein FliD n=1 Tax=Desulforamulus ruminis TaxID=1564 RepID=UPI0023561A41|nr:flagellar filament capping protein FliD [Desulforamulus ruminis]